MQVDKDIIFLIIECLQRMTRMCLLGGKKGESCPDRAIRQFNTLKHRVFLREMQYRLFWPDVPLATS